MELRFVQKGPGTVHGVVCREPPCVARVKVPGPLRGSESSGRQRPSPAFPVLPSHFHTRLAFNSASLEAAVKQKVRPRPWEAAFRLAPWLQLLVPLGGCACVVLVARPGEARGRVRGLRGGRACWGPGAQPGATGEGAWATRGTVRGRGAWERAEELAGSPFLWGWEDGRCCVPQLLAIC